MSINPNWCTLCRQSGEDMDHSLIHCNVANNIWIKLQNPIEYHTMVEINIQELCTNICCLKMDSRRKKKSSTLWPLY